MSLSRIKFGTRWLEVESQVRFLWRHSTIEPSPWSEKKNNFRHIRYFPKMVFCRKQGQFNLWAWCFILFFNLCSPYADTLRSQIRCTSSVSLVLLIGSVLIRSFLFSEPTLQWLSDTLETFLVSRQTTLWCPSAMSKCGKRCLFLKLILLIFVSCIGNTFWKF